VRRVSPWREFKANVVCNVVCIVLRRVFGKE
jgi:hypothetical protein